MKKVLSAFLLISTVGTSPLYGACPRCEWKNCKYNSNLIVRKGRAAACAVNQTIRNINRTIRRWTRTNGNGENGNESVYRNRTNGNNNVTKTCTSKNCPIHNEGKACKNFCTKCGRHHIR